MKKLIKRFTRYLIALEISSQLIPGFSYRGGVKTLLLASLVFVLLNKFLKPILKIFFLPINLLTLGFFRWITNALLIFILQLIVKDLSITGFQFAGFELYGFVAPSIYFSPIFAYVAVAFLITLIYQYFIWLNS